MGRCYASIVVNAPIDRVWKALRDFHRMAWAQGVIETLDAVGSLKGDQVGAKRILNGLFHETLLGLSDVDKTIQYSIDDGPGPLAKANVQRYVGTVRLHPVAVGEGTFVEWSSDFEANEGAKITDFCLPIYHQLLKALKKGFQPATA